MVYEEQRPPTGQSTLVSCYWRFIVESSDTVPFEHIIMPDGTVSLSYYEGASPNDWRVSLAGPGVAARKIVIGASGRWLGIRFRAGVVGAMWGLKAGRLRDRTEILDPRAALAECMRAALKDASSIDESMERLSAHVTGWIAASRPLDAAVVAAATAICEAGGHIAVADLGSPLGLGIRQLRRRFVEEVGLTLKEYARARRVRRAFVDALGDIKSRWADISCAAGYADQAHLARDFKTVFGMTPQAIDAFVRSIRHQRIVDR
jgi:AraC-like DNA-binding protein